MQSYKRFMRHWCKRNNESHLSFLSNERLRGKIYYVLDTIYHAHNETMNTAIITLLLLCLTTATATSSHRIFPQRTSKEAAVIEWGHSAVISALDGAVATFGPQTSQGASFEVETGVVLADPIDGLGSRKSRDGNNNDYDDGLSEFQRYGSAKLNNADGAEGKMLIMTDAAGLSGVTMARIAKEAGAAALTVVNTDPVSADFIYSLSPLTDEERAYAEEHVDIPVVMVSLQAGNVITTAMATEDMDPKAVNRGEALPERVRLYAGGDRPFFEDVVSGRPLVYLIHNMLTNDECEELLRAAEGKYDKVDDTKGNNYLENSFAAQSKSGDAKNIQRTYLWKGGVAAKLYKDIDERMSQVMGFPIEHYSDFRIDKHQRGSEYGPHYDVNDANAIMATVTVFLNDVPEGERGELVFPSPEDGGKPVMIRPRRGLAVVHHNTDEKYNFDKSTVHQELPFEGSGYKYVATKFVYLNPQPKAMRIVLPLLALPFGGRLPKVFSVLQNALIDKFGYEKADVYFQKIVTMLPIGLLMLIGSIVSSVVSGKLKQQSGEEAKKKPKKNEKGGNKSKGKSKKTN